MNDLKTNDVLAEYWSSPEIQKSAAEVVKVCDHVRDGACAMCIGLAFAALKYAVREAAKSGDV